jgi:hypothetical protein
MTTDYPAAPGYKPTTDQMLALWRASKPLLGPVEEIEMEIGFYEWLGDILRADLFNLRSAIQNDIEYGATEEYIPGLRTAIFYLDSLVETL